METTPQVSHPLSAINEVGIPKETAFSIMFVSVGMVCFIWQAMTSGEMFYKTRKPIVGIVFVQSTLGVVVTFVTLLTSLVYVDCTFRLLFSVVGVNIADMSLQFVLLWKAYLGNNRSKLILFLGSIPILSIAVFIWINMTIGKSKTFLGVGLCSTEYPLYIVVTKAAIDCTANTFLSGCFILVIYRHYPNNVLGGSTPILYTIDWYLASYLIIKQLTHRGPSSSSSDSDSTEDDESMTIDSESVIRDDDDEEEMDSRRRGSRNRDTVHSSMDGTLVPTSPKSTKFPEETMYPVPTIPYYEPKTFVPSSITFDPKNYSSSITDVGMGDEDEKTASGHSLRRFETSTTRKLSISQTLSSS
ncbi:uncharacterized protein EV154DRAFT_460519 [Mucor mucedo]|uniref:uncharacterized protein n=1 Tax=Mucor mucedo TaxID=29922 RepID=UPI00221FF73F|nr:uncharacterized protein EV154DRAFT_460519 [Mucor mucedo]KAI7893732.1 hypothetical protein EV154DRAFT_460519 [Mucor mucedo]